MTDLRFTVKDARAGHAPTIFYSLDIIANREPSTDEAEEILITHALINSEHKVTGYASSVVVEQLYSAQDVWTLSGRLYLER